MAEEANVILSDFFNFHSKMIRVMKIAEKREVRIPIIKVVAKPLIGPEPNTYSTIPVNSVVTCPSIIATI